MIMGRTSLAAACLWAGLALLAAGEAHAELVLSQLVVELEPKKRARQDIELWNSGSETLYVAVEPREILGAGTVQLSSLSDPNPEKLGLLVAPSRLVVAPGERKLLRVAAITDSLDRERVYRVTVKPVVGQVTADQGGLKILVGYDVLVLVRPSSAQLNVRASRSGDTLTLQNDGNVSVELTGGQQCDASGKDCRALPGGRLYSGASKSITIDAARRASYVLKLADRLVPAQY